MEITTPASAPTRRHDRLGIHSLDHFCFSVPDLGVAKQFYTAFGLDVRDVDGALHLYTFGHPHCWAIVRTGAAQKQIQYLSFGAYGDEMDAFRVRLRDENVELLRSGEHVTDEGLWFHDCDGRLVQIKAAAKSSPDAKSMVSNPSAAAGARGAGPRAEQAPVRPSRLAHILLFTTDLQRVMRFYSNTLGLRLSDEAEVVAFMHGAHGSDHHLVAFGQANGAGLHHSSWDVCSIQEVGLGAMQMAAEGYSRGWGVGRHVLGSNYFYYVRDPWDSYAEYSCDIDYVPADIDWPSQAFTADNGFYLWAPPPPEDFAHDYE
ncbi:VOC family protein [Paraburkholderia solitsugae]|uniref:VOC family protein n=1 Tax=Paraburkholderia solitsugae TaxID=2675748 RepID=UPI002E2810F7|nr:VOC family protein [Paraburkholderia solitsugae]